MKTAIKKAYEVYTDQKNIYVIIPTKINVLTDKTAKTKTVIYLN